ncbi:MAG: 2-amino-4-hydroxy-6-hydroxymethyldihydropteridine diphosphokinase [Sulfurifustaceae bacterium]
MPRVYVSIGSNIDRVENIRGAIRELRARFGAVAHSAVYESPADGFDGENFYNLVAAFDADEPIEKVRAALNDIEAAHGRVRTADRFGPRTLDVDILLYGDLVRHDDRFDIPRGEITECAYVLRPLAELAPEARHPETGARFTELWRDFNVDDQALWTVTPDPLTL